MATKLATRAEEGSTYGVKVTFTDSVGSSFVPLTLKWTLTDRHRNVINNRRRVIETPAAVKTIVLKGADLSVSEGSSLVTRFLLVEGTYNGDLGNNLPVVEEFEFEVEKARTYPQTTTTTTV